MCPETVTGIVTGDAPVSYSRFSHDVTKIQTKKLSGEILLDP